MPRYGYKPSKKFEPVEAGTHVAWLLQFIDLGTHMDHSPQYGSKEKRLARFTWAFPDLLTSDGKPMIIGRTMTLSPHEKAGFRKMCATWMGRRFTDREFMDWDEREMFNVPCMVNVAHRDGDDGPYAVFDSLYPVPKNMPVNALPEGADTIYIALDAEKFDQAEFDKLGTLSERFGSELRNKIESSPEWAILTSGGAQDTGHDPQWHTDDPLPADDQGFDEQQPPAQPPAQQRQQAPRQQASVQQRQQAPRQQASVQQRPQAAPQQARPVAAQQQVRKPIPQQQDTQQRQIARTSGPAPQRPAPAAGSVSQRAMQPRPNGQTQTFNRPAPQRQQAVVDQDIGDEIPF